MGIVSSHILQHLSDIDGLAPQLPGHAIPNGQLNGLTAELLGLILTSERGGTTLAAA